MKLFQVSDDVYFGGAVGEALPALSERGINAVLSLREMPDVFYPTQPELAIHYPISDEIGPRLRDLRVTSLLIGVAIEAAGAVYVHCQMGIHRAPNVAAGWLIANGRSVDAAVAQVLEIRPRFEAFIRGVALEDFYQHVQIGGK